MHSIFSSVRKNLCFITKSCEGFVNKIWFDVGLLTILTLVQVYCGQKLASYSHYKFVYSTYAKMKARLIFILNFFLHIQVINCFSRQKDANELIKMQKQFLTTFFILAWRVKTLKQHLPRLDWLVERPPAKR